MDLFVKRLDKRTNVLQFDISDRLLPRLNSSVEISLKSIYFPNLVNSSVLSYNRRSKNVKPINDPDEHILKPNPSMPHNSHAKPIKVFTNHHILDNFYLNTMDINKSNCLAIGCIDTLAILNSHDKYIISKKQNSPIQSVCLSDDSKIFYCTTRTQDAYRRNFYACDFATSESRYILNQGYEFDITCIRQLDSNTLVLGTNIGYVGLFDLRSKSAEKCFKSHSDDICNIKLRDNLIISGGNDNFLKVMDIRTMQNVFKHNHNAAIKGIDVNSNYLLSGGGNMDKTIKIFNLKDFTLRNEYQMFNQVTGISFIDGKYIAVSYGFVENCVKLYEVNFKEGMFKEFSQFEQHRKRILNMIVRNDSRYIYSSSSDGDLKKWRLDSVISEYIQDDVFSERQTMR